MFVSFGTGVSAASLVSSGVGPSHINKQQTLQVWGDFIKQMTYDNEHNSCLIIRQAYSLFLDSSKSVN